MHLTEALSIDTSVTDESVRIARQAAEDAATTAAELDAASVADTSIAASDVAAARDHAALAVRRAEHVAQQAQRAAEARRVRDLAALGTRIDDAAVDADDTPAVIGAALREIAQAAAHLRQVLAEHDATVRDLMDEANRLGAEPVSALGPMPTSAHVAVDAAGVRHEQTSLVLLGQQAEEAIARAAAGDQAAARALFAPVVTHDAPRRDRRLFVASTGNVFTFGAVLPQAMAAQVKRGELVELPADLAEQYQLGRVTDEQIKAFALPLLAARRSAYRAELARPRGRRIHTEPGPAGLNRIGA